MEALIPLIAFGFSFWVFIREAIGTEKPKLSPPKKLPELPKKALTKPTYVVHQRKKPASPVLTVPKKRSEVKEKPFNSEEHSSNDDFVTGINRSKS